MSKNTIKINLNKIVDVVAGQSPKSIYYSSNEGVPFLQGNRTFGGLYPTIDTYTKKVTKLARKGDLLISVRAPVGDLNFAHCDLCIGRGLAGIRAKNGDNNFVYYALKFNLKKLLKKGTGTTFDSINKDTLEDLEIIIPETEVDRFKISKTLSNIDAKIELNNQINAELEKMAKTIYDYWFVQFDFPDANGKPYKSSGGKMVWSDELKREIPEGWEVKNLFSSQYSKLVPTGVAYFEGEKIYLSTSEVENSQIINHSIKTNYLNRKSRANMQPKSKTIWFARMKDTKKIILIDDYCDDLIENYIFSTGFAGIELKNNSLYFLWNYINSKDFEDIKNRYSTGTTQKSITNEGIEKIKILIPSQDLLNIFDSKASNVYQKIYVNNKQNQTLAELRDWLLPMLMNGQVKVE